MKNNILLLKGQLVSRKNPGGGGSKYKEDLHITKDFVVKLRKQLEAIRVLFVSTGKIEGVMVDVHYNRIVPKSSRVVTLFRDESTGLANDTIRGARFNRKRNASGGIIKITHVFTHYVTFASFDESIETLRLVEKILAEKFDAEATYTKMSEAQKASFVIGLPGKKTLFLRAIKDLYNVEEFTATSANCPISETAVVSLYNTGIETKDLLSRFDVRVTDDKILDGNIVQLKATEIQKLNDKAPYLISMSSIDLTKIPKLASVVDESIEDNYRIPPHGTEPIVGVLDTAFDQDAYFSDWVEYEDHIPDFARANIREKIHGTAVSSIIVDGPHLNPWLDDGCGRFRVRHFRIASLNGTSVFMILKRIRKIVAANASIKVWNLSLGSTHEVDENCISPVGAELDRIQKEYGVIFVVAGTNVPQSETGRQDMRVGSPADSLNSIVVNAVDREGNPASYTRIGPVLSFFYKPDVCCFGGDGNNKNTGMRVCRGGDNAYMDGTSFAAPWIARKLAYLIYTMGLSIEVAKGLIIDAAAGWDTHLHDDLIRKGYGSVPINIDDVIKSDEYEIKFVITGTAEEYETHTYEIPVPIQNGAHPYFAKASLIYFPDTDRNQGVDYTVTEMDVYFGRTMLKDGKAKIMSINNNKQDGEDNYGPLEESARKLFRKWDNVKHVAEVLNPRARPRQSTVSQMWGLKILSKDRRQTGERGKVKFGVILTLKAMDKRNRINEFIDLCQMHHWIVHPVVPVVRVEAFQQASGEINFI